MAKTAKKVKPKKEQVVEETVAEVTKPVGEKGVEEEAVQVTRPSEKEEVVVEAREEAAEVREPAAEMPLEKTTSEEGPLLKRTVLAQCMENPPFRSRVIYHLVKKLS